jgi:hypothetical protein
MRNDPGQILAGSKPGASALRNGRLVSLREPAATADSLDKPATRR